MVLFIDTTKRDDVAIELRSGKEVLAKRTFFARRAQAEKLLPEIEKMLKRSGKSIKDVKKILVAGKADLKPGEAGSFSSLRIGVVTANALAFALGVPIEGVDGKAPKRAGKIQIVVPQYDRKPKITAKKKK